MWISKQKRICPHCRAVNIGVYFFKNTCCHECGKVLGEKKSHYGGVFFYGIYLDWSDFQILLRQVEALKPKEEDEWDVRFKSPESGAFDAEKWYTQFTSDELHDPCEVMAKVLDLITGQVTFKVIEQEKPGHYFGWAGNSPYLGARFCLAVTETYVSKGDLTFTVGIPKTSTEIWDKLLRETCQQLGIPWRQPQFHLDLDLYRGLIDHLMYEAHFFYGMIVTEYDRNHKHFTSNQGLYVLVKEIISYLQKYMHTFDEDDRLHTSYGMFQAIDIRVMLETFMKMISPEKHRKYEELIEAWNGTSWTFLKDVFHSEEFRNWQPDIEWIESLLAGDLESSDIPNFIWMLDILWAKEQDPICIGSLEQSKGVKILYLGIRSTQHQVFEREVIFEKSFQLPVLPYPEWNTLLQTKCEKLGLVFRNPSFFILRSNSTVR